MQNALPRTLRVRTIKHAKEVVRLVSACQRPLSWIALSQKASMIGSRIRSQLAYEASSMYVQLSFSYKELVFVKKILLFLRLKRLLKRWRVIIKYHMIRYRQGTHGFPDIAFSIPILREDSTQRSIPWMSWLRT